MDWEYSCGAVVFTRANGNILYVIVQEQAGAYSFPKGHMEGDETELETACREVFEETGLYPDFLPGFREEDEYDLSEKPGTRKRVTYFLAEYMDQPLIPRQGEIRRIQLLPYDQALFCFTHEGTRSILTKAQTFLTQQAIKDSICIKLAETDEELCGRGYVHCTSWQEAYRGIVCDQYLDSMTVEATTARARQFPENTLVAKDKERVVGFAVYGPSRDEDLPDAGEVVAIYVLSEYYGRKIGYRLMNEAFSRLREYDTVFVWVLEKNERAICFYHKYGFEFDGCKKQWNLGTPVSIVRMIKKRE